MLNIFKKKGGDLESNSQDKPLPKSKDSSSSNFFAPLSSFFSELMSKMKKTNSKFNAWLDKKHPKIAKYKVMILICLILFIIGLFIIIIIAAVGGFSPKDDTGITGSKLSGKGEGTFYDPNVAVGACGWQAHDNQLIAAMNKPQYGVYKNSNDSPVCGICIKITGPKGSVKAKIVDECLGCKKGDIDMSPRTFKEIGNLDDGRIPISWEGC